MMRRLRAEESGLTLIEVLVAISLFAVVSIGFYQVLFNGSRGADTAQDIAEVSEEARLGFNRMIRDTREAAVLESPTPTSYRVKIDFDSNGDFENPNDEGDFEDLIFSYDADADQILLTAPGALAPDDGPQLLIDGVEPIPGKEIFDYASNFLEYDWGSPTTGYDNSCATTPNCGDGVTQWQEIDRAVVEGVTGVGNNNGQLDGTEDRLISSVIFSFRVTVGERSSEFYSEAQIRNRR